MKTKILDRQSLLDVALQTGGTLESALAISIQNNVPLSGEVTGMELNTLEATNNVVVKRYKANRVIPATDISREDIERAPYGGIDFMGIEIDFIVS